MKFLLDENLSERLAELLCDAGHDAVHVKALGLSTASDSTILARAAEEFRVLVSGDTDFGALVAMGHRRKPSIILYRRERPRRPEAQATLLLSYLDRVESALDGGAIVVVEETRLRVRDLPIVPEED